VRLGLQLGYDDPLAWTALAEEAERCGLDAVWTSEAYGSDAVTPLAWLAGRTRRIRLGTGVLQIPARTAATTAATAATLDILSGGRLLLGLGASGPQVVEGWHGAPWGDPLGRTREYVAVVRAVLRREAVEHHGRHVDLPFRGPGATGEGRPLRLIVRPPRPDVPVYLAANAPGGVALAAEIADGWLPMFVSPERLAAVHGAALGHGFALRGGRPEGWDLAPQVPVAVSDDAAAARDALRPLIALYVGGMGSRRRNFYARVVTAYGYGDAVTRIQDHFLAGRRGEAAAAVPDALIDEVALVGDRARIRDRLGAWRDCGATSLVLATRDAEALRLVADLAT
jgi:F420-dependent oxidoreductase-like protein